MRTRTIQIINTDFSAVPRLVNSPVAAAIVVAYDAASHPHQGGNMYLLIVLF